MFTAASDAAGFKRERVNEFPADVDPPANAHRGEACDAQGAVLHPLGPETTWLTAIPPPAKANEVELPPAGSPVDGFTAPVAKAGTSTLRRTVGTTPLLFAGPIEVITPVTRSGVELVR